MTRTFEQDAEVLRVARIMIEQPENWTKGVLARHRNGNPIGYDTKNAYCFCMVGALCRASNDGLIPEEVLNAVKFAVCTIKQTAFLDEFNDDPATTHADVLAAMDLARARLEKYYAIHL